MICTNRLVSCIFRASRESFDFTPHGIGQALKLIATPFPACTSQGNHSRSVFSPQYLLPGSLGSSYKIVAAFKVESGRSLSHQSHAFVSIEAAGMMYLMLLALAACFAAPVLAQTNETIESVTEAFSTFAVVPDVLSSFAPIGLLDVVFTDPSTGEMFHATPGTNLTMERTSSLPLFLPSISQLSSSTFAVS